MPEKDLKSNPKPKNRLFIFFSILLLVLFISVLFYAYLSQIDVFWLTTNEMIVINTREYEKTISLWFAPRIKLVETIYEDLLYFNLSERDELDSFFTSITDTNEAVMATYIATEDKQIVFDRGQTAPEGFDPTVRVWYVLAMENFGKTVVSEPYIDILTGKVIVTITRAIELNNGLKGAIGVDIDLSEITEFVNNIHSYKNGSAFLLSQHGNIVTHRDEMLLPKDVDGAAAFIRYSDLPVSDVRQIEVSSSQVTLEWLVRDDVQEYVSTTTIESIDWIFGIKIPISDFNEDLWQITTPLLITLIIGLGVFASSMVLYLLHMMQLIKANNVIEKQKHELAAQMRTIEQLGLIDALTGIPNRRNFDNRSSDEWKRCAREKKICSLCMIDIDHFKNLNDTYGHPYGDEVLKKVADILKDSVRRTGDIAARWGGEEFAVLLPNVDSEAAQKIAEDIRLRIETAEMPLPDTNEKVNLTISAGVATITPNHENSVADAINNADKALYNAKQTGRNKVCVFR